MIRVSGKSMPCFDGMVGPLGQVVLPSMPPATSPATTRPRLKPTPSPPATRKRGRTPSLRGACPRFPPIDRRTPANDATFGVPATTHVGDLLTQRFPRWDDGGHLGLSAPEYHP
jgi:hypothetical protein